MSVYEKKYEVCVNLVGHYVNTPEEALTLLSHAEPGYPVPWVNLGYADCRDADYDRTEVIRRRIRSVPISEIELLVQKKVVAALIERLSA